MSKEAYIGFWSEVLQAPSLVIEWIQEGYKLPLVRFLPPFFQANHKSALEHAEFVTEAVGELLNHNSKGGNWQPQAICMQSLISSSK